MVQLKSVSILLALVAALNLTTNANGAVGTMKNMRIFAKKSGVTATREATEPGHQITLPAFTLGVESFDAATLTAGKIATTFGGVAPMASYAEATVEVNTENGKDFFF